MRDAKCLVGCLAAVTVLLATSKAVEPLPPELADSKRISQLIEQLNADTFAARDDASEQLAKLGEAAEEALVQELKSPRSREVEQRATALVKAIRLQRIARNAVKLADVIQDVRLSNQARLDPVAFEAKLQRLIDVLGEATETKPTLPVKFGEVAMQAPNDTNASKAMIMGDSVSITFARQSIILADTAVQISHASNCIIIARYVVDVNHSDNCLIIAGRILDVTIDRKSTLLSGAKGNVTSAHDSIVAAPEMRVTSPQSVQFVNCGGAQVNRFQRPNDKSRSVETQGLVLEQPQRSDQLTEKMTITYSMGGSRQPGNGFVLFKRAGQGGEYVVRVGNEPHAPDGSELPELKGWTLRYSGRQFAVFRNGEEESCLSVSTR